MKNLIASLLLLTFLFPEPHAWPALQPSDKQFSPAMSAGVMANPGFEFGVQKWSASGGTLTTTTTAANVFAGNAAGSWDSSSAGQTLVSSITYTNGGGPTLTNGAAGCMVKCASGTCTHTFTVDDGSTNLATPVTITSSTTNFTPVIVNYVAGTGGTIRPKFTSVASNEPILYVDGCWAGSAKIPGPNLGSVQQAFLIGSTTVTGCSAGFTRANTAFGDSTSTPTGCVYTTTGQASAPATMVPGIRFANGLPAGHYAVSMSGVINCSNSVNANGCFIRMTDGTTASKDENYYGKSGATPTRISWNYAAGSADYTTAQGDTTFKFQMASESDTNPSTTISGANAAGAGELTIRVYYFPTSYQAALFPNQPVQPTVQYFTSGSSATYTTPAGVTSLIVTMCGPGGGGSGAGTTGASGNAGSTATTFGSILTAREGTAGNYDGLPTANSANTITSPAVKIWQSVGGSSGCGSSRQGSAATTATPNLGGCSGGSSPFGGAGSGGSAGGTGNGAAASANSGSGGGAGYVSATSNVKGGSGGNAGNCLSALINNPSSTYTYTIGTGGGGGTGTGSGPSNGGAGADGFISVFEFYGSYSPVLIGGVQAPQNTFGSTVINNTVSKSSTYTLTTSDETVIGTASITVNLPAAASVPGKIYHFRSNVGFTMTVTPNASEVICENTGGTSIRFFGDESGSLQSDGTKWFSPDGSCIVTHSAVITCSASSSISNQVGGGWLTSLTNRGAGGSSAACCNITVTTGAFNGQPNCTLINYAAALKVYLDTTPSTSTLASCGLNNSNAATDSTNGLICQGPR